MILPLVGTGVVCQGLLILAFTQTQGGYLRNAYTIKGPETKALAQNIRGRLLVRDRADFVEVMELPSLRARQAGLPPALDVRDIAAPSGISGPDVDGGIAYLNDYYLSRGVGNHAHVLRSANLDDGASDVIFQGKGGVTWDDAIGAGIALAPKDGAVACVMGLKSVHSRPLVQEGRLEVWNIKRKNRMVACDGAIDKGLSWLPDGKTLLYVSSISASDARYQVESKDGFAKGFRKWEKVPAVFSLDIATGQKSYLHSGWHPIASSDGRSVLLGDVRGTWIVLDLKSRKSRPANWPGLYGSIVAFIGGRFVIYWGLPTEGAAVSHTNDNSPLTGAKIMLTIKVAELDTGRFQTLVPDRSKSHGVFWISQERQVKRKKNAGGLGTVSRGQSVQAITTRMIRRVHCCKCEPAFEAPSFCAGL